MFHKERKDMSCSQSPVKCRGEEQSVLYRARTLLWDQRLCQNQIFAFRGLESRGSCWITVTVIDVWSTPSQITIRMWHETSRPCVLRFANYNWQVSRPSAISSALFDAYSPALCAHTLSIYPLDHIGKQPFPPPPCACCSHPPLSCALFSPHCAAAAHLRPALHTFRQRQCPALRASPRNREAFRDRSPHAAPFRRPFLPSPTAPQPMVTANVQAPLLRRLVPPNGGVAPRRRHPRVRPARKGLRLPRPPSLLQRRLTARKAATWCSRRTYTPQSIPASRKGVVAMVERARTTCAL